MEKVLDCVKGLGPAFGNVFARLAFELLPSLFPKPGLIAVDRLLGDEDDGVVDDFGQNDAPVGDIEFLPH
jgi:hypothetical protein